MLLKDIYVNQIVGFTNKLGLKSLYIVVRVDEDPNYVVLHPLNQPKQHFKKSINNLLGVV